MTTNNLQKIFCSACGKELIASASICTGCGTAVKKLDKEWSAGSRGILTILALFMPLIGGIAGLIALFSEANRKTGISLLIISFCAWMFWTFIFMGMMMV